MRGDESSPEMKAAQKTTEACARVNQAVVPMIRQMFKLCYNLLSEEARCACNKIIEEQIDCKPWMNLHGDKHAKKCHKSLVLFMEFMRFHLLTTYHNDAAEVECFNISNGLKKPNRVPICQFIHGIQQCDISRLAIKNNQLSTSVDRHGTLVGRK